jgi:hypothetical protein
MKNSLEIDKYRCPPFERGEEFWFHVQIAVPTLNEHLFLRTVTPFFKQILYLFS